MHWWKTDLKPLRTWAVPCNISQSVSRPSVGQLAVNWKRAQAGVMTLFTLSAGILSSSVWQSSIRRRIKWAPGAGRPLRDRHAAAGGRADLGAAEAPLAANSHVLERVLQLRPLHLLPGTHHPGPEVSDPVHVGADHLGLLLPAVLLVGGQLPGRTLQKNVSNSLVRLPGGTEKK